MNSRIIEHTTQGNPEVLVDQHCQQLIASGEDSCLLVLRYQFEPYWLSDTPVATTQLLAVYFLQRHGDQIDISLTVTDQGDVLGAALNSLGAEPSLADIAGLCRRLALPLLDAQQPQLLQTVAVAKPWGQEIWYTGIEQRGVAGVTDGTFSIPLPWLLSALPDRLVAERQHQLILLKILDPVPQEVFGDLYFELHQQKREVYVVTAVDEQAWPSAVGAIRYGFNADMRHGFDNDEAFRGAFVIAVKAYEKVRRQIDTKLDGLREQAGIDSDAPIDTMKLKDWLAQLPVDLIGEELSLRQAMNAFTDTLPLAVGDVVKVPCLTPHALQHGVRTIEFQTPVYERLIVSFAQKVLTQPHWDTDQAAKLMALDTPEQTPAVYLLKEGGVVVERIVDFDDFEVQRVSLASGASYNIPPNSQYGLVMAVKGVLALIHCQLQPEQAALLPKLWSGQKLTNNGAEDIIFLLSYPRLL